MTRPRLRAAPAASGYVLLVVLVVTIAALALDVTAAASREARAARTAAAGQDARVAAHAALTARTPAGQTLRDWHPNSWVRGEGGTLTVCRSPRSGCVRVTGQTQSGPIAALVLEAVTSCGRGCGTVRTVLRVQVTAGRTPRLADIGLG